MKVLVIEDSPRLRRSVGHGLKKIGYSVDLVGDGKDGLDYARLNEYDVIILDLMLPSMDGLTILTTLRNMGKQTHILILSAKDRVEDRVRGLELGADDYMIKPFSFDELCARISTLVRRRYQTKNPEVLVGPLTLNTATRTVRRSGKLLELTPGEYSILEYFVLNRGRVLSKEQLVDAVHDSDSYPGTNVIEVMICNLRKKIGQKGKEQIIKTRRGHGYFIDATEVS